MNAVVVPDRSIETLLPDGCALAYGRNLLGLCWWCGATAVEGPWCSLRCVDAAEEAHVWRVARAAAVARVACRCTAHGCDVRRVEVHHREPVAKDGTGYEPGCAHHAENLAVLCKRHHVAEHRDLRSSKPVQMPLFRAA